MPSTLLIVRKLKHSSALLAIFNSIPFTHSQKNSRIPSPNFAYCSAQKKKKKDGKAAHSLSAFGAIKECAHADRPTDRSQQLKLAKVLIANRTKGATASAFVRSPPNPRFYPMFEPCSSPSGCSAGVVLFRCGSDSDGGGGRFRQIIVHRLLIITHSMVGFQWPETLPLLARVFLG